MHVAVLVRGAPDRPGPADLGEKLAPRYDTDITFFERVLFAGGREWVCARAKGRVLEMAVRTGRNLPFYPARVQLMAIDFSPAMLAIAHQRAAQLGMETDLREGNAQALEFEEASFDTVGHDACALLDTGRPQSRG